MKVHRSVVELASAHFLIDKYSSMLGAFLPFLHRELGLTLSEAGILGGILIFSSSLMQPVYGFLSDRLGHKIFSALAPAVAGTFIASLGVAPSFGVLALFVFMGGAGIAAFHPQGASLAASVVQSRAGFNLSFFIAGGMIGYSLGPVFISSVILMFGLKNSFWAALPGILMSIYLLRSGPSPQPVDRSRPKPRLAQLLEGYWLPLSLLYILVVIRSIIQLVFVAFLPLYFTTLGKSEMEGSQYLSLFLLAGGVASFIGGILADRYGGKKIIAISMAGCFPFLFGFLTTEGPISIILCTLGGAFLLLSTPVNVAMAQRLIPEGAGTVSALMMGFAWGVGGLFVPLVGSLSDLYGLQQTLIALIFVAVPGFLLALVLPRRSDTRTADLKLDHSRVT